MSNAKYEVLTLWGIKMIFIMLSVKQRGIKYHFLSLWYVSTSDWTPLSRTTGEHTTTVPITLKKKNNKNNIIFYSPILLSPSSPRRGVPTKNTLPSSETRSACWLSWPVTTWTILGDFVMGNSAHFPAVGPPCLIPKACDLPQ